MSPLKRNTIYQGDVLEVLRTFPDESIHCVVTSPPYFGLRQYGTGTWVGGDPDCEHETIKARGGRGGSGPNTKNTENTYPSEFPAKKCSKCGAAFEDKQIGLEELPEEYISRLVEVFREVKRVLRKDGTVWLNLGDSFASNGIYIGKYKETHPEHTDLHVEDSDRYPQARKGVRGGEYNIKPKDLLGIPWRVALALQEDGWWLRRDIIWAKAVSFCPTYSGSCMPEPVTDRPTSSHEYVFLLTKSGTPNYWMHRDNPHGTRTAPKPDYRYIDQLERIEYTDKPEGFDSNIKVNCPSCNGEGKIKIPWFDTEVSCGMCGGSGSIKRWKRINLWSGEDYFYDQEAVKEKTITESNVRNKGDESFTKGAHGDTPISEGWREWNSETGRNLRSVWTINPQPYPEAHFATFSTELTTPMIKLGASEYGACPKCGAPWVRIIKNAQPKLDPVTPITRKGILLTPEDSALVLHCERGYGEYRISLPGDKHHEVWSNQPTKGGSAKHYTKKGYHLFTWNVVSPDEEWKRACGADSKGEYSGKSEKWLKQDALGKQTYTGFNARWKAKQQNASDVKRNVLQGLREVTYEWKPSCDCGCEERVPCVVLDIFGGSGTIGEAARAIGRDWVLIELNPEYVKLAEKRLRLNESLTQWV